MQHARKMCSQPLPSNLVHFRHLAYEKWVYRIWRGFSNQMKLEKKTNCMTKRHEMSLRHALNMQLHISVLPSDKSIFFFSKTEKRKSFFYCSEEETLDVNESHVSTSAQKHWQCWEAVKTPFWFCLKFEIRENECRHLQTQIIPFVGSIKWFFP